MEKYRLDFFIRMTRLSLVVLVTATMITLCADYSVAQGVERQSGEFDACLMRLLKSAEDDLTVGRIKEICAAETLQVTENPEAPPDENALEKG